MTGAASDANGWMKTEECEQPGLNHIRGSKGKGQTGMNYGALHDRTLPEDRASTVVFIQQCDWWYIAQCTPGLLFPTLRERLLYVYGVPSFSSGEV
jgi:hypothetical protein